MAAAAPSLYLTCRRNKSKMFPDFREVVHNHNPVGLNSPFQERPKQMKLSKFSNVILFGIILSISAVGCKTKPISAVTPLPQGSPTGQTVQSGNGKPIIDDGTKLTSNDIQSTAITD